MPILGSSGAAVDSTPIDAVPSLFTFGNDYLFHVRSLGSGSPCVEAVCRSHNHLTLVRIMMDERATLLEEDSSIRSMYNHPARVIVGVYSNYDINNTSAWWRRRRSRRMTSTSFATLRATIHQNAYTLVHLSISTLIQ